jgi:hypothetical protein
MNEVLKNFEQVLNKGFLALSSKFAQNFSGLASTKSATFYKSNRGVLGSFLAVSFFLQSIYFLNLHRPFFAVKSLEANLVINSAMRLSR